jgi:hypothetical protein
MSEDADAPAVAETSVSDAATPVSAGPVDDLDQLDRLPVAEHVAHFEAIHDALRSRLEARPAPDGAER